MATKKTSTTRRQIRKQVDYTPYIVDDYVKIFLEKHRAQYDGSDEAFKKAIRPELEDFINEVTVDIRKAIAKGCIKEVEHSRKFQSQVGKKILKTHKGSLQLFDFLIQYNASIARECYLRYYKLFKKIDDHLKLDALIEIHTRACQIACEINLLAKHGYADGALARWRSIHELCSTFLFLYDNDTEVTKMYADYAIIETYAKIKKYEVAHPKLNWKPISKKEIAILTRQRQELIDRYGKEFAQPYGWTMKILPAGQRHFKGIEESVAKDELRGIYSWSSENVHAGILGNRNRLGLPATKGHYLLNGPSQHGLFDPMQFTTYSLNEMTSVLLGLEETTLNEIKEQMLWGFHDAMVKCLLKETKPSSKKKRKEDILK